MIEALPAIPDAEYVIVGGPEHGRLKSDPEVRRLRSLATKLGGGRPGQVRRPVAA